MATSHEWILQSASVFWIFTLLLSESQSKKTQTYYMDNADCGRKISIIGAVIYSHEHHATTPYRHHIECKMIFKAPKNSKIMLRVMDMDIPDLDDTGFCNDALYVYNDRDIFSGAMEAANGNIGLCGSKRPKPINSTSAYLTLYFRTNKSGKTGHGFKLILTAFSEENRKTNSCGSDFQCDNKLCINKSLTCDGVDHCGDGSDESETGPAKCQLSPEFKPHTNSCNIEPTKEEGINKFLSLGVTASVAITVGSLVVIVVVHRSCAKEEGIINKFLSLGVTASVAITVGSLVVIVVVVVAVVCCCRKSSCRKSHDSNGSVTSTGSAIIANGTGMPYHPGQQATHAFLPNHTDRGYHPMTPVPYTSYPSLYTPLNQQRDTYSHSSHPPSYPPSSHPPSYPPSSHAPSYPPSYHRSHTPTSSKSGKSIRSNNSLAYSQVTDKIMLPVNL